MKMTKTTHELHLESRITFAIKNGNVARVTKWSHDRCLDEALDALEETGWESLAAAYRHLDNIGVNYSA
jgi:hypothetical protein